MECEFLGKSASSPGLGCFIRSRDLFEWASASLRRVPDTWHLQMGSAHSTLRLAGSDLYRMRAMKSCSYDYWKNRGWL